MTQIERLRRIAATQSGDGETSTVVLEVDDLRGLLYHFDRIGSELRASKQNDGQGSPTTRYEYLIAYSFQGGVGRTFATCDKPIDSRERVESVERSIQATNGIDTVAIMSFNLLRSF